MGERTVSARQARYRARIQTDLCPGQILAGVAIGYTKPERDTMKPLELREVIADMISLLPAALYFDVLRRQWRQFRDGAAGRAKQSSCDQKTQTRTHDDTPERDEPCTTQK
jgi:hypothetical protein